MGFISWCRTIYLIFGCLVLYMFYKLVWGKLHDPLRHLLILSRHNLISSYQAFWSASLTMLIEIIFEWNELWSLVIKSKGKWEREREARIASFWLYACSLKFFYFLFLIFVVRQKLEILKDCPSWFPNCRNLEVLDKFLVNNGTTTELMYTQVSNKQIL